MIIPKKILLATLLVSNLFLPTVTAAEIISNEQKQRAQSLLDEALKSDLGFSIVESLTTEIGPRLAGSEAEQRALKWGKKLGESLGFDRVVLEEFKIPFWDRGELEVSLIEPYAQQLYATALGGAAPSKGAITADIVYLRSINDLMALKEGDLKNKVNTLSALGLRP